MPETHPSKLPLPAPRLLVFDLDGTLIDSSLDLCHAVNAALEHVGRSSLPHWKITGYIGDGAAMLMRRALGEPNLPAAHSPSEQEDRLFARAFDLFLTYYRAHKLDNTRTYPGVLEALRTIRFAHPRLPMAVLTNKPVHPSGEICKALGLAPFFFANYGGNSFSTKKPDPAGLLRIIAEANNLQDHSAPCIAPADTVMIGDSDVDVLTARRCGARTLGCAYGLSPEALASARPDAAVERASEWKTALGL